MTRHANDSHYYYYYYCWCLVHSVIKRKTKSCRRRPPQIKNLPNYFSRYSVWRSCTLELPERKKHKRHRVRGHRRTVAPRKSVNLLWRRFVPPTIAPPLRRGAAELVCFTLPTIQIRPRLRRRGFLLSLLLLFVSRTDSNRPRRGTTGPHAGETMSRHTAQMRLSSRLSPIAPPWPQLMPD